MATVTPNFNWPVPTSTDLVKDGATAIEALGDSIDGSLVDLKGGTTGQVLSKTSGTDMDFTWVTTDDANAIQNSIVNAKGDLIGASANDTPAILSVGANGETLVADSSTSTGLRYQANTAAGRNPFLNASFDIAQRGTSTSGTNGRLYTLDRWCAVSDGAGTGWTVTQEATNDTTNLPNIRYCARVKRTTTGTSTIYFSQSIETANSIPFAGRTVTLSFYARKGSDFSASGSNLTVNFSSGTGIDQNALQSFTGATNLINTTATLTTTWQRFTYTVAVGATATELAFNPLYTPTGTTTTNDYFEITGIQLEIGSVATAFARNGATIQGELAACQRYYWRTTATGNAYQLFTSFGSGVSTTSAIVTLPVPTKMRVTPSSVDFSTLALSPDNGTVIAATNATMGTGVGDAISVAITSSGLTQFRPYQLLANNSTSAFIGVSAEL